MVPTSARHRYIQLWAKVLHLSLSIVLFFLFFLLFRYGTLSGLSRHSGFRYNYFAAAGYGVMLIFFTRTYNAYLLGYMRTRQLLFGQLISQLFSMTLMYFIVCISWNQFLNPLPFLPLLILQIVVDILWSYYGNKYYYHLHGKKRTLLIYRNQVDKFRFGSIKGKPTERLYIITDELQYDGSFTNLKEQLEGYDAIFVAGVNSRCRNGILKYCKEKNIPGFFLPHVGDMIMQSAGHVQVFDSPVLYVSRKRLNPEFAIIKRAFDIVSSGIALIILSPLLLIAGLAIKLYDGGPILYRQTRLTKDGKEFDILKLRSMRVDAEKDGVARLSNGENDDRITPVGRIIRRLRFDEIPQLWNILVGDMSVVGPRPERPEIAKVYYEKMPDFELRLQVKAGLTGYAQVYGRYNTDPYEKLEFDLLYINNMSIFVDLQLCFATFATLFDKDSTQGIAENKTMAMIEDEDALMEEIPENVMEEQKDS